VVACINEEFAKIQEEESHPSWGISWGIPQEISREKPIEDRIVEALAERPDITHNELSLKLNLKPEAKKTSAE